MQSITNKRGINYASCQKDKRLIGSGDFLSRYWKICRITPASERIGYEYWLVRPAQEFFQTQFDLSKLTNDRHKDIQTSLLLYFYGKESSVTPHRRAIALLCLRCDVSYFILKACQKIDSLFGVEKYFTYKDLLPFVLNDDGQDLIVLDRDAQTQLILNKDGTTQSKAYSFFTVEILRTYKWDSHFRMSLANWAYLQTKQNQELKDFLSEFGFKHYSDWALLNKARPIQIQKLSLRERHLIDVFHAVYRRDRRKQQLKELKRCPDPNEVQVTEMLVCLEKRNVIVNTQIELIQELKQVATHLRHYDIWTNREPLESYDPVTGEYLLTLELPSDRPNELDAEEQEFLEFLHQQLKLALTCAIEQEIIASITKLQKSKRYNLFVDKYISGLKLYYCENMSLKEIAPQLGMTGWDQAKRVLNPGQLLNKVRTLTIQQLLDIILKKAQDKGLTKIPPEADYLKNLAEQVEIFADEEVFQEAAAEIRAGKMRSMKSLYAEELRLYFKK